MRPKIWSMFPVASIRRTGHLGLLEVVEHGPRLGAVLAQAVADDLLGVVAALDERAAAAVADAGAPRAAWRRRGSVAWQLSQVRRPAMRMTSSSSAASQHQHVIQLLAALGQHARRAPPPAGRCAESRRAGSRARCPGWPSRSAMRSSTSSSGTSWPLSMNSLARLPSGVYDWMAARKHVAGRDVRDLEDARTAAPPASPFPRPGVRTTKGSHSTPGFSRSLSCRRRPCPRPPRPRMRGPRGPVNPS